MKVTLKRLQIVNGFAYHKGEQEVPDAHVEVLRQRDMIVETAEAPKAETPKAEAPAKKSK